MAEAEWERQEKERHRMLVAEMENLYRPILEMSSDGMFVYLDDAHKACNRNLADLWGYSKEEWDAISPFLPNLVTDETQFAVMQNYKQVRETHTPARVKFTGRRQDGSTFEAEQAMVPIHYKNEFFTLNLIKPV